MYYSYVQVHILTVPCIFIVARCPSCLTIYVIQTIFELLANVFFQKCLSIQWTMRKSIQITFGLVQKTSSKMKLEISGACIETTAAFGIPIKFDVS